MKTMVSAKIRLYIYKRLYAQFQVPGDRILFRDQFPFVQNCIKRKRVSFNFDFVKMTNDHFYTLSLCHILTD